MKIQKPTIGRIVIVAIKGKDGTGITLRPAVVVATDMGGPDGINCRALLDGSNDNRLSADPFSLMWLTSIHHLDGDLAHGQNYHATWHYPPRSTEEIEVDA
jgi:hypothetical protein